MSVGLVEPEFTLHMAWIQLLLARWAMRNMNNVAKGSLIQTIISYVIKLYRMLRLSLPFIVLLIFYKYLHLTT